MKKGFTLAEILISIVIIGVVAALTIPTIATNYQKKETVVKLKKAYLLIVQATQDLSNTFGIDSRKWNFREQGIEAKVLTAYNKNIKHLDVCNNYIYHCSNNIARKIQSIKCYGLNGAEQSCNDFYWGYRIYELPDGMILGIKFAVADSGSTVWTFVNDAAAIVYVVDINGYKKPNKIGKDIFYFSMYSPSYPQWDSTPEYIGRIVPYKLKNPTTCTKNDSGNSCAVKIMKDGWQIKDDYPW